MELTRSERMEYKRVKVTLGALQRRLNRKEERQLDKLRRLKREAKQMERRAGNE